VDEAYQGEQMYVAFAHTARDEGLDEIADWFDTLAKAERAHAARFRQMYQQLFED
jgi:rubrerythrin